MTMSMTMTGRMLLATRVVPSAYSTVKPALRKRRCPSGCFAGQVHRLSKASLMERCSASCTRATPDTGHQSNPETYTALATFQCSQDMEWIGATPKISKPIFPARCQPSLYACLLEPHTWLPRVRGQPPTLVIRATPRPIPQRGVNRR